MIVMKWFYSSPPSYFCIIISCAKVIIIVLNILITFLAGKFVPAVSGVIASVLKYITPCIPP